MIGVVTIRSSPRAHAEPAPQWVALGDSYSSGEGTGPYDPGTNLDRPARNGCHRGPAAYPRYPWTRGWMQEVLYHVACSGATIQDYYSRRTEVNEAGNRFDWGEIPQRNYLTADTRVVTVTMGGNDVGFGEIARACLKVLLITETCSQQFGDANGDGVFGPGEVDAISQRIALTGPRLQLLYRDILADAPNAAFAVIGYPRIFDPNPTALCAYSQESVTLFNRWTNELNGRIAAEVTAIRSNRLRFIDITDVASGRELCSSAPPIEYFTGIAEAVVGFDKFEALHPITIDYQAIARAVCKELPGCEPTARLAVVLAIDASNSMAVSDPGDLRLAAAQAFLGVTLPGDLVGVVAFDGSPRVAAHPVPMPFSAPIVSAAIGAIRLGEGTNIGGARLRSCEELQRNAIGTAGAVFLLTDGQDTTNPFDTRGIECVKQDGYPVFSAGLGLAANAPFLEATPNDPLGPAPS